MAGDAASRSAGLAPGAVSPAHSGERRSPVFSVGLTVLFERLWAAEVRRPHLPDEPQVQPRIKHEERIRSRFRRWWHGRLRAVLRFPDEIPARDIRMDDLPDVLKRHVLSARDV